MMTKYEILRASGEVKEISLPGDNILRHFLTREEIDPEAGGKFLRVPATLEPPPVFRDFYYVNIGDDPDQPILLQLRFEQPKKGEPERIGLLMTNERYPYDLELMAGQIIKRCEDRGLEYTGVIGVESLGSKLSQEIARQRGRRFPQTTIQKGKPMVNGAGERFIGPPKNWVDGEKGVSLKSGTSVEGTEQSGYLDQKIAAGAMIHHQWLLVDDALLSRGTVHGSLELMRIHNLSVTGVATVLNESGDTTEVEGYPYVGLTKAPLFLPLADKSGITPKPGTYGGLAYFYVEK